MVLLYEEPQYEVIDPNPSYLSTWRHMRLSDWGLLFGLTASGIVWGYLSGRGIRKQCAFAGGVLGFFGGHALTLQNTSMRLMGLKDNGRPRRTSSSSNSQ